MSDHKQMRDMPDLRHDDGLITLEHCSVILERISQALSEWNGPGDQEDFDASLIDPSILLDFYNDLFVPVQFQRLFATEMGKGVLAGVYLHGALERMNAEDEAAALW